MATATTKPTGTAAPVERAALLHSSLFEGRDVAPITKGELRTILEFFAAGISGGSTTEVK